MVWSQLVEALLLVVGGLVLCGVWLSARRRDRRIEQALRQSEERFRHLTSLSADWFWETDAGHRIIWLSGGPAVAALFGGEMAHGKRLWEIPGVEVEPRALVEHFGRLQELDAQLPFFDFVISRSAAGEVRTHEVTGKPFYDNAGRFLGYRGIGRDITERRRARELLTEREQRFRDVLEASGEYVWETDAQWRYTFLSERVETILGYPREEMIGRTPRDFMPLGESRAMEEWFAKRVADAKAFRDLVHRSLSKSGRVVWQSVSGVPVHDAAGALTGYRGTGADITARTLAEDRVRILANSDALTGLPNRVLLADRAGQAILAAARARGSLAVLFIDLDRFKLVNDSLGHAAGDALLCAVAERLGGALQRDDTLARTGGDEFVLLSGLDGSHDPAALAQRARSILARPFLIEGRSLIVSASIGISVYPGDGRDFAELLKNAGSAANHAKETGRDRFRFYSPELNARAVARLEMENDLHRALARGEFLLHWQPVVSNRHVTRDPGGADRVVGAEVLLRWQHPQDGMLMPDRFIPVAEECGLIRPLGLWTLERALSQIGAWRRMHGMKPGADLWFALNVSAHELAMGDAYVAQVVSALEANQVPGACIELEITERVLMSHLAENVETLHKLARHGVRVAIDDFGTGYSSLAYLRHLPIDKLKIDRSFLRELDAHPADATIVQAIAAMAKALGLRVAAEGVESEAQLERLEALGCDEWQGYHFSASLDAPDFERLFTTKIALAG